MIPSSSLSLASSAAASNALTVDSRSLNALKVQAGQDGPQAARETAKQFESLFMREMIKSMREATMKSGLLDGAEGNLANDLFDQQMAVKMSGLPGGLADTIQRQLLQQMGGQGGASGTGGQATGADLQFSVPSTLSLDATRRQGAAAPAASNTPSPKGRDAFVQHHRAAAERVAQESGIPAAFMLGQAGHETGWGKSEIRQKGGANAHNLFGIKAGGGWTGKVAEVTTTEYVNGAPRKVTARFRAYDSYEDSFRDYARLINENPRYDKAQAVARTGSAAAYAAELQKAGYATDPQYAAKLSRAILSTQAAGRPALLAQADGTRA